MIDAKTALEQLKEGNKRFVAALQGEQWLIKRPQPTAENVPQSPFAIILGCSDSRVPAEIVFDQGLGDLFVIRIAGNIVQPSQIGSVEFAAAQFGTPLVVVMGHSDCGAVKATIDELSRPTASQSPNLKVIVDKISPSVRPLMKDHKGSNGELVDKAIRANVLSAVENLKQGSVILEDLIAQRGLTIVGAEYSIKTGEVTFFDE